MRRRTHKGRAHKGRAWKIILGVVVLLLLLIAAGVTYIGTPYFTARAGRWLTHQSGRNVVLDGDISADLFSREPRFLLTGIRVGNAEWGSEPTMFEASRIEFSLKPLELLRGRLVIPELIVDQPRLLLEKEGEKANWHLTQNAQVSAIGQPMPDERGEIPVIRYLRITDGKLTYRNPAENILTTLNISTIKGTEGREESLKVTGKGSYQKNPFSLNVTGAPILQLREAENPYPFTLEAVIGPTSAVVDGTVKDPVRLEAFNVNLKLKGEDAADLFPITGIVLPPTPPYQVEGRLMHEKKGRHWHFENFSGHMGNSDLKGDIKWNPGQKPPYLEGNFTSVNLDMADLEGFIGAHRKPRDETRILPDTPLDISRLLAVNADVIFRGERIKRPDILDDFAMDVHLKDGVLTLDPLSFGIATGEVQAKMTIEGLKKPPAVAMDVDFKHLSLHNFFAPLAERYGKENVSAGVLGGRAELKGTGKSMRDMLATSNGTVGIGMEGGQLSRLLLELVGLDLFRAAGLILTDNDEPVPMRCVIAHFTVENGIMNTDAFLVDTEVTALQARGGINLANETIGMQLTSRDKSPSPLSARSPIEINGTLKKPNVGVNKPALAARGGVAAALALVAPPAAWLAFIEPGLGRDGNCTSFIQRMKQETGAQIPAGAGQ
jgi:AsmA family protein